MNARLSIGILPLALLGCARPNPAMPSESVAAASGSGGKVAAASGSGVTLHVSPDGSIRENGQVLYDPQAADASSLDRFLAEQRAKNPLVPVFLLAGPDVSIDKLERASQLSGEGLAQRGPITFQISGWVQSSFRSH